MKTIKSMVFTLFSCSSLWASEDRAATHHLTDGQIALATAAAAVGGLVIAEKAQTWYIENHPPKRTPLLLLALMPEAVKLGVIAAASGITVYSVNKVWRWIKMSLETPYEKKVEELNKELKEFEKTQKEHSVSFEKLLVDHQQQFEKHLNQEVDQQLEQAKTQLQDLLKEWFNVVENTNAQVITGLEKNKDQLVLFESYLPDAKKHEFANILSKITQESEKLKGLHSIPQEILKKYNQPDNPFTHFFNHLFQKKN